MNTETIIALLVELATIAGFGVALGKRDARLEALETRCKEERDKNSEQHKEFYATRDTVTTISVVLAELTRRIGKLEEGVEEILRRLPGGE